MSAIHTIFHTLFNQTLIKAPRLRIFNCICVWCVCGQNPPTWLYRERNRIGFHVNRLCIIPKKADSVHIQPQLSSSCTMKTLHTKEKKNSLFQTEKMYVCMYVCNVFKLYQAKRKAKRNNSPYSMTQDESQYPWNSNKNMWRPRRKCRKALFL